jgi:hypothetical protein
LQVDLFEDSGDSGESLLELQKHMLLKCLQRQQLGHVQQVFLKLNILLLLVVVAVLLDFLSLLLVAVVLVDIEQEQD